MFEQPRRQPERRRAGEPLGRDDRAGLGPRDDRCGRRDDAAGVRGVRRPDVRRGHDGRLAADIGRSAGCHRARRRRGGRWRGDGRALRPDRPVRRGRAPRRRDVRGVVGLAWRLDRGPGRRRPRHRPRRRGQHRDRHRLDHGQPVGGHVGRRRAVELLVRLRRHARPRRTPSSASRSAPWRPGSPGRTPPRRGPTRPPSAPTPASARSRSARRCLPSPTRRRRPPRRRRRSAPPPTTAAAAPVSGWNAVGQYWSNGVRALCAAGLPVTAIARPCRPAGRRQRVHRPGRRLRRPDRDLRQRRADPCGHAS